MLHDVRDDRMVEKESREREKEREIDWLMDWLIDSYMFV